jgi:hypothetical protein
MIWGWLFGWIKVDIPKEITPLLSFCVFAAMVVIGANLSQRTAQTLGRNRNVLNIAKGSMVWIGGIAIYFLLMFLVIYFVWGWRFVGWPVLGLGRRLLAFAVCIPILYLLLVVKPRRLVIFNSLLLIAIGFCLMLAPLNTYFDVYEVAALPPTALCEKDLLKELESGNFNTIKDYNPEEWRLGGHPCYESISRDIWHSTVALLSFIVLFQILWMAVILFSPLQQLTRRLVFVVIGVLTLIVLSEISKLNLHQYLQPTRASDLREHMMPRARLTASNSIAKSDFFTSRNSHF